MGEARRNTLGAVLGVSIEEVAVADAIVGLGGNLGEPRRAFALALARLAEDPRLTLLARSALYESPALGPPQPNYLNAAVRVAWRSSAEALLSLLLAVERQLGRVRAERWGPRTVDLDFLWWSEGALVAPGLTLPHPELHNRAFALGPLLDVAPELGQHFGARLEALSGRPPLAQPGWMTEI